MTVDEPSTCEYGKKRECCQMARARSVLWEGEDDRVAHKLDTGVPVDPWKTDGFANVLVELANVVAG
jgi:hypothetical protein